MKLKLNPKKAFRLLSATITISLLMSVPLSAIARADSLLDVLTPFYEASCQPVTSGSVSAGSAVGVYFIGDSIGRRTESTLKNDITSTGGTFSSDTLDSRNLSGTPPSPDGLTALKQDAKKIKAASAVVVELGTNTSGFTAANVDKMIKEIASINSSATIYWVDTVVVNRPAYVSALDQVNKIIYSQSSTDNYQVISWSKAVLGDSADPSNINPKAKDSNGYIDNSDGLGVHPTLDKGVPALANLIASAVSGSTSNSGSGNGCTCPINFSGGSLPASVPEPYNAIFTQAGAKYQVSPALIAAIFYAGEHGSSWPNPPPPYGSGSAWATSSAGAEGPFQFLPSTWQEYGVDGNGDGVVDIQDLTDAAFGAANLFGANGAAGTVDETAIKTVIYDYNHSQTYVDVVWNAFVSFSQGGSGSGSAGQTGSCQPSGAFTNPFPGGWIPNRLDMGYDGTFTGQIVAPFSGTVTYAADSFSNWGGYMEIQADQVITGLPTSTLYFAEGVSPSVNAGQHVSSGDPIAVPAPSPWGDAYHTTPDGSGQIEWGVAVDGSVGAPTDPLAESGISGYSQKGCNPKAEATSGPSTPMVLNFAQWVEQNLGVAAPANTYHAGCA